MNARGAAFLLLLSFAALAEDRGPDQRAFTCADGVERCEFELEGKLVSTQRSRWAKWDDLQISLSTGGEPVGACVNIPNRRRLKLKAGVRYHFKIAVYPPFETHDRWVIDAKRL